MKKLVEDLAEEVTIDRERAGLYLPPDDFEEVRTKTADAQGRVNLGIDRAGKDVKVVVIE